MTFYTSLFKDAEIIKIERYGEASFRLNGQTFMCIDSPVEHPFTFPPSISLFVLSDSEEDVEALFKRLSEGGETLMSLDAYPFSK